MAGKGSRGGPRPKEVDWHLAERMIRAGFTDQEVCKVLGIHYATWKRRKAKDLELCATIKEWKAEADDKVERSLFERACGYSHPDTHVAVIAGEVVVTALTKHYPPDATSCIFWLKNRRPDQWRDKNVLGHELEDGGLLSKIYQETLKKSQGIPKPPNARKDELSSRKTDGPTGDALTCLRKRDDLHLSTK